MIRNILVLLLFSNISFGQTYRYLPPKPFNPPALNNTINPQIANQNVNFNIGIYNNPQYSGTFSYTQVNTPKVRINNLYGFGQNNFGNQYMIQQNNISFLPGTITPSGYNPFENPYYQMATNFIGGTSINYSNFGYPNYNYQIFNQSYNTFNIFSR